MNIQFEDKDLQELVETGKNKEYKKVAKVKPLMIGLAKAYNYALLLITLEQSGTLGSL